MNLTGTKYKVFLGYLIVVLIILSAAYISYDSIQQLLRVTNQALSPNENLRELRIYRRELIEANDHAKLYLLLRDEEHIRAYFNSIERLNQQSDSLMTRFSQADREQYEKVRKVNSLVRENTENVVSFLSSLETNQAKESDVLDKILDEIGRKGIAEKPSKQEIKKIERRKDRESSNYLQRLSDAIFPSRQSSDSLGYQPAKKDPYEKLIAEAEQLYKNDTTEEGDKITKEELRKLILQIRENQSTVNQGETQMEMARVELIKIFSEILNDVQDIIEELDVFETAQNQIKREEIATIVKSSLTTLGVVTGGGFLLCLVFLVVIIKDISRTAYYRQQLEESKRQSDLLAKSRETFLATMSHEIRSPITAIYGFSQQLDGKKDPRLFDESVQVIKSSSAHLLNMVNNILDFNKTEQGKKLIKLAPFKLAAIMQELNVMFAIPIKEAGLDFKIRLVGDRKNLSLLGDEVKIKQVLINLIDNAVKFTSEGKITVQVSVKTEEGSPKARLIARVLDTGQGIKAEEQELIYEDFEQVQVKVLNARAGSGLGLSISKRIIEDHGGTITLRSIYGKGSTFGFDLQLEYELDESTSKSSTEKSTSDALPTFLKNKTVFVLEDDQNNRRLLELFFSTYDLKVHYAANIKRAQNDFLRLIEKNQVPDIILSDIHLPDGLGNEWVAELIENLGKKMPFAIAMTADVYNQSLVKSNGGVFDTKLIKPYTKKDIENALASAIQSDDQREEEIPTVTNNEVQKNDPEALDCSKIIEFIGDEPEALLDFLIDFKEGYLKDYAALVERVEKSDWDEVQKLAHKMINLVEMLQEHELAKSLKTMEYAADPDERLNAFVRYKEHQHPQFLNRLNSSINHFASN
ncbi:MAG: hypothetical protein LAT68_13950 [Cyclobacteriaceae bacterium]|nr:hypothetical protein [Cyclobacteriaceae bacterium]MCH8517423.1 hypothetical protein [Cyclobacteriaceae bacterium]